MRGIAPSSFLSSGIPRSEKPNSVGMSEVKNNDLTRIMLSKEEVELLKEARDILKDIKYNPISFRPEAAKNRHFLQSARSALEILIKTNSSE